MACTFPLGRIVITATAQASLTFKDVLIALGRHASCDWGDLADDDIAENNKAVVDGHRILSSYADRKGTKFWIITEADRSTTTTLLPSDY